MPSHPHALHAFDLRSVVLFSCLTVGGTCAAMAQTTAQQSSPLPALMHPITPSEIFMRNDLNHDGQLSRHEAENLPSVAQDFEQWDRDGNGQLSLPEFLQGAQKNASSAP